MSYRAQVFRVMIASPSDVEEEREIAVQTIQEWNDRHSAQRQVVLLPMRWETHAAPAYGTPPQEVINTDVVDHCDLLVGVFWTRVGSPTETYESGSIEEIDRVASAGKPVLLYFSKVNAAPDDIDPEQLKALRDFKSKISSNALINSYTRTREFGDKLSKHLEIHVARLLAESSDGDGGKVHPYTRLELQFAAADTGKPVGDTLNLNATNISMPDFDSLPDYGLATRPAEKGVSSLLNIMGTSWNKDYCRQTVVHIIRQNLLQPVPFWLKNSGGVGARDIYAELTFTSDGSDFVVLPISNLKSGRPSPQSRTLMGGRWIGPDRPEEILDGASNTRTTNFQLPALQPQRAISVPPNVAIAAPQSCTINVVAKIYADSLSRPFSKSLQLHLNVTDRTVSADAFLRSLKEEETEASTP